MTNLQRYGDKSICRVHKGWFAESMRGFNSPARMIVIDCDTAKGTRDVLAAMLPCLTADGAVFSQDFPMIRGFLENAETWVHLGKDIPLIKPLCHYTASIRFVQNHEL